MFTFKLELDDGTPADPPTFITAVTNWKAGDTLGLGPGRSLVFSGRGRRFSSSVRQEATRDTTPSRRSRDR